MALTDKSIEMSFSLSRLRSALRSMSIGLRSRSPCSRLLGHRPLAHVAELDQNLARAQVWIAEPAVFTAYVKDDRRLVRGDDPALDGAGGRDVDAGKPSCRAPPVPRLGERAPYPRRGNLECVGHLAHNAGGVERGRQLTAEVCHLVETDPAVLVHHDAQQP